MKYKGLYLNLDRCPDRRAGIEAELSKNGLSGYSRYAAVDGCDVGFPNPSLKIGEIGCFASYHKMMEENRSCAQHLHVIEDDILLSPQTGKVLDWIIDSGHIEKYDIICTDVAVPLFNDACHAYKEIYDASVRRDSSGNIESVQFSVVDMKELIFASTCSFLVNKGSVAKLAALLGEMLRQGARQPVDLFIRTLCQQGLIRVGCVFPFVTSIKIGDSLFSTIDRSCDEMPFIASNILRHTFFIGADLDKCKELACKIFPQPDEHDLHRQIMLRLIGYSLTSGSKRC